MSLRSPLAALALLAAGATAHAGLFDNLQSQVSEFAMPALGQNTLGNAAGVLEYCVKNNYLGHDAASLKDKLMGKLTGQPEQKEGFAEGAKGLLQGSDGKSLNLQPLSAKIKEKACDYVLKNATSLI